MPGWGFTPPDWHCDPHRLGRPAPSQGRPLSFASRIRQAHVHNAPRRQTPRVKGLAVFLNGVARCGRVCAGCRIRLIDVANVWLRLADQAEKNSHLDLVYETPERPAVLRQ